MEPLKTRDQLQADHLSHPLVIKMGGRQWVVGGEHTTPVEMDKSDKLISLSTLSTTHSDQVQRPVTNKHLFRRISNRYLEMLTIALDGLLGPRQSGKSEVSGTDEPVTGAVVRHIKSAKVSRTLRQTFQLGSTFGLIFGCISLFLFHQLEPSHVYADNNRTDTTSTVLAGLHRGFTLPSIKVYTLQTNSFGSEREALRVQSALEKQGIHTVIHQNRAYALWCGLAIHAGELGKLRDHLASIHVNATETKVAWNAQSMAGPSGESEATAQQISRWLSASASCATTLTGVLSDGGVAKDALRAFETAKSLQPSADAMASTGYQKELTEVAQDIQSAFTAYQHNHADEATGLLVKTCDALSRIQTSATALS